VISLFDNALSLFNEEFVQIFDEKPLHDVLVRHTKMLNQKIMNKSQKPGKGFHEEVPKSDAD